MPRNSLLSKPTVKRFSVLFNRLGRLLVGFIAAAVIGYLNWMVIHGWFGGEGPANIGSIEVSYVSMARFLVDFGYKTWAPFWYFGFPFHLFYTPLLPFLEAILHNALGWHLWEAYRFITGFAYILAPISVFILGWVLSERFIGGFVSGILYSVVPTLYYFILPGTRDSVYGEVAADRFSATFWDPRRFTILIRWGEGPHTLSLVFLPLVGALFMLSLKRRKFWLLVLASLFFVLTALSNALGMLGAVILALSIAFVHFARESKDHIRTATWTVLLLVMGLGLASFWYNLSFIMNFFAEGGGAASIYLSLFPWGWLAFALAVVILYFVTGKLLKDWGFASSLIWFLALFFVVYVFYSSAPPELSNQRIELLPQALRYITQVDLAFSVLVGVTIAWALKFIGRRFLLVERILSLILAGVSLYAFIYIQPFLTTSYNVSNTVVDLSQTREETIATLLEKNVDPIKGERVFLPGNYGFYLNWFTNVWQHRGGLFQAATHPWPDHVHYQMANGQDSDISRYWLKAINAKYIVIPTPESQELYKEIKNQERFEDFEKVYEKNGDIIYRVPLLRPSIAKPVDENAMISLVTPEKGDDEEALQEYVRWVERSSETEARFEMVDHDHYVLSGSLEEGEVLLVQMTADSGWSAMRRNAPQGTRVKVKTGKDPLGFLVLYPDPGDFEIELTHSTTWQLWLGYLTTFMTIGFIFWYGWASRRFAKGVEKLKASKAKRDADKRETGKK